MPRLPTANTESVQHLARTDLRPCLLFAICARETKTGALEEVPSALVCFGAPTHRRASAAFAPRKHTMGRAVSNRRDPGADRVCAPYAVEQGQAMTRDEALTYALKLGLTTDASFREP